ncbi:hypothetical protein PAERUG_P40_Scotland_4_VIM_2_09_12_04039 [Pseudomonas aeruginosa]|nr:adenylosuccinate synthase [Pseudomonas aeruginosa]CRN65216.1 hypothetical protein PAERUG_P40_Scotland_4_VIM_2_09_12_04039 [Pseudomonas aeruginosa]
MLKHRDLCALGSKWLLRPNSRGGHGCHVAHTELFTGWGTEMPDAIGFRMAGHNDGSIVLEVKVSRADFLADAKKPHRQPGKGLGRWRYFLCPDGLISPEELPVGWGLLYASERGVIQAVAGPARVLAEKKGGEHFNTACEAYSNRSDKEREVFLLTHLLARVSDAEQVNLKIRKYRNEAQLAASQLADARRRIQELEAEILAMKHPGDPGPAKPRARRATTDQQTL